MKLKVLWIAGLMLAATAGQVQAGFIARAAFAQNAVNYAVENADVGVLTPSDGFLTLLDGEVFGSSPGTSVGKSYRSIGSAPLRIDFAGPVSAVGFNAYFFNSSVVLFQVFDSSNNLLDSFSFAQDSNSVNGFIGLDVGANLIKYAIASGPDGNVSDYLHMDDIIYQTSAVPEPATVTLWGIGALGMGLVVRRRKKLTA